MEQARRLRLALLLRRKPNRCACCRSGPATPAVTTPLQAVGGVTPGDVVPMSVMRKKIAEHMVMSKRTSAHVHGVFEVDMTRVVKLRESMKGKFEQATGNKLTYTPFFARAVIHAIRKWPIINSSVEGENIHYHPTHQSRYRRGARLGTHRAGGEERRGAQLRRLAARHQRPGRARSHQEAEAG